MSRKITLKNEQISQFLRTDDAIKALETSVDNGQIRLALQILVEIVNDLNSAIVLPQQKDVENTSVKPTQEVKVQQEKVQNKQKNETVSAEVENNN